MDNQDPSPSKNGGRTKIRIVKKGLDPDDRRRKQESKVVQIRKQKNVESLSKRRMVST